MSESKTIPSQALENLSIRARRGELSADEQRTLEKALETYPTLRVAHQIGRDFDQQLRVRAGDDALVFRASTRALDARRPRRRRRFALVAGLAAALVASVAVASALWRSPYGATKNGAEAGSRPARPAPPHAVSLPRSAPAPQPSGTVASGPEPALPAASALNPSKMAAPAIATPEGKPPSLAEAETAASLFRRAGAARRAGNLRQAQADYAELQSKFPNSNEAQVSRVSLGKLLLAAGRAREAERELATYVARGGGTLREEALVGRAEALAQLGESGEESRVWQELLRSHGSSVYAARARQRLLALQSSGEASPR